MELTRQVTRPKPRATFATTKRFIMHRSSLRHLDDFTDAHRKLLRESFETVGPGAR